VSDAPPPYLLGLRLAGRLVVVAGGGPVATRRVAGLREAGADVAVVAPEVTPTLQALADSGDLRWERRAWREGDAARAWVVHACTSSGAVNEAVAAQCEAARVWCVRADDAAASAAWTPAVGGHDGVTVAVHGGGDPRRAAAVRDAVVDQLREGALPSGRRRGRAGSVALVGGGPGDPELITVRGRRLLAEADVVVTDRLAPLALLDRLGHDVIVVDAAKVPGGRAMPQEEINATLVAHAREGRFVVRLKGGDPYVLGRGMEEALACAEAGIPVEVVPGVSAALAVPALAGIPLTHRGVSQSFTVVSGHVPPGDPRSSTDWAALAAGGGTLVLLMAVDTLPAIAAALVAGGRDPHTPVACVQDGASPRQRSVVGTLASIGDVARRERVRPPAVIVVGGVVDAGAALPR